MSTTTTHRYESADELAVVIEKLGKLQQRAEKKGLNGSVAWSYTTNERIENGYIVTDYELTLTYEGDFALGQYRPVAVIDFTGADEGLVMSIDHDVEIGDAELDATRCDHCHKAIRRNKVIVIADEAGELLHVGGTCAKDFLGHDPEWMTWVGEAIEPSGSVPTTYPIEVFVAAAIAACRIGYRPVAFGAGCTREIVAAMLSGAFAKKAWEAERELLAEAPAARQTVDEVLAWARSLEGRSDFDRNLRKIANSTEIGRKAFGLAAYLPAGADKWLDKEAERKAKAAAEAARKAAAEPVPVTDKRIRIEGVIATIREVGTDFGVTTKVRVVTDAGWACWGTLPAVADDYPERGDRIAFDARIERSDDDETFGFFSRPTKGEVLARAAETVVPA